MKVSCRKGMVEKYLWFSILSLKLMLSLGMNKLHCVYSCLRGCPGCVCGRWGEEGIQAPSAGVTGNFEPWKVDSENQTLESMLWSHLRVLNAVGQ